MTLRDGQTARDRGWRDPVEMSGIRYFATHELTFKSSESLLYIHVTTLHFKFSFIDCPMTFYCSITTMTIIIVLIPLSSPQHRVKHRLAP